MKFNPAILLLVAFGSVSCATNSESESSENFPNFEVNEAIVQSPENVLGEVTFIPLKISEESPVQFFGFEPQLAISDSRMFINVDPYINPSIHEFDLEGNHILSIDRKGGGPNEYESIDKMGLNQDDNLAIVSRSSLLEFDENLDIQKRENLRSAGAYFVNDFHPFDQKRWLVALRGTEPDVSGMFKNFALFDQDSLTYEFLPLLAYPASGSGESGSMVPYEDGFLLNFGMSDTIYYYSNEVIEPLLSFHSGDRSLPNEKRMLSEDQSDEELEQMIATQTYDVYFGNVEAAGETVMTQVFGITPKPLSISELEELNEAPKDFPVYEVYMHPKLKQIKATKIIPGMSGMPYSDGKYLYRLLYTEVWNALLESGQLGEQHTAALVAASEQLNDIEDPIIMRYKINWEN